MAEKREKKKRGCCGIFLWLLIIIIVLIAGSIYLYRSGLLLKGYNKSIDNVSKAMTLDGFDFDMDITSNDDVDPDFKNLMNSYEELCYMYVDLHASKNPVSGIVNYIKLNLKANTVNRKLKKVEGKKLSAADYYYFSEVKLRVEQYGLEKKEEINQNASTDSN